MSIPRILALLGILCLVGGILSLIGLFAAPAGILIALGIVLLIVAAFLGGGMGRGPDGRRQGWW